MVSVIPSAVRAGGLARVRRRSSGGRSPVSFDKGRLGQLFVIAHDGQLPRPQASVGQSAALKRGKLRQQKGHDPVHRVLMKQKQSCTGASHQCRLPTHPTPKPATARKRFATPPDIAGEEVSIDRGVATDAHDLTEPRRHGVTTGPARFSRDPTGRSAAQTSVCG